MGLDIVAVSRVTLVDVCDRENDDHWNDHFYVMPDWFEDRAAGLEIGRCYTPTPDSETHGFRAGSYSGYNDWRNRLAQAVLGVDAGVVWTRAEEYADRPFYELINFADNEGTLGPEVCRDLLADWDAHPDLFKDDEGDFGWNRERYEHWRRAFELGADGGLVDFH